MIVQFEFGLLCTRVPRTLQVYNKAERQFSVDELDACIGKKFGDTRRPMLYVVLIVYVRVCVFLIFCVCVCPLRLSFSTPALSQEAVDKEMSHRQAATLKGLAAELHMHFFRSVYDRWSLQQS